MRLDVLDATLWFPLQAQAPEQGTLLREAARGMRLLAMPDQPPYAVGDEQGYVIADFRPGTDPLQLGLIDRPDTLDGQSESDAQHADRRFVADPFVEFA